jgi:hypothetical protein
VVNFKIAIIARNLLSKTGIFEIKQGIGRGLWTALLPTVSRLSRQCGILNISQPYRPPKPVTGIALLYGDGVCFL